MKRLLVSVFAAVLGLAIMAQATPQTQNAGKQEKPKTQQTQQSQGEKKQEKKKTNKKVQQKTQDTKNNQTK